MVAALPVPMKNWRRDFATASYFLPVVLRWNYVQDVTDVLCAVGYPAEEAMLLAQLRLGHSDLHHTWRYNRRG
jgi:hypothetical protein